ncbi:WD repeat-containing protein 18-like [Argiope bruennichi]|uniref:WD repeat-containing protein 18 n=1 Tax=Argiope bruennichi TaxID=94029 RepID=A0A8T0FTE2_ARGBR|nr:WD repeat-containing protein 18-like [Argiope bruennichi]KAF8794046.1 WD repeat-containing protein 18 [Argiope bruennichi]
MDSTIPEVIIASSKVCSVFDATNSNEITSYKDENPLSPKTLCLIADYFLIAAYSNKPMLKVWTISKVRKQETGSFVVPGQVSALAVSNCGTFCIAGIKQEIYVWDVSSGEILSILDRHYQDISCLKFTADDSRFFSGGKDGHVMVWVLSCVVDVSTRDDTIKPHFVWNKHSAAVTDIYSGHAVSRVATTSLDMTCNIYELDSGLLLSTICMDSPLTSVVMDPLEYFIFLGDGTGYLYKIDTYEKLQLEIHKDDVDNNASLKLHDTSIFSLSISSDGTRLMTVSEDSCKVWHMLSMSCILNIPSEGKFTNAFLAVKPPCLTDPSVRPHSCIRAFQKENSPTVDAKKYIETSIQRKELSLMYDGCPDKFISSSFLSPGNKVDALEESVEHIFEDVVHGPLLNHLMTVNHHLYANSIKTVLNEIYDEPTSPK